MFLDLFGFFFAGLLISLLATSDQIAASKLRVFLTTVLSFFLVLLGMTITIDLVTASKIARVVYAGGAGIGSGVGVLIFKYAGKYFGFKK